jgi:predicted lipoprotein with Yx(FWY)xxD motif
MRIRWALLVAFVALGAAACGADPDLAGQEGAEDTTTTTPRVTTTTIDDSATDTTEAMTDDGSTTMAAEDMTGVHVSATDLGEILVGPDGLTLYVFTADSEGMSACYDACADLWPPVPGTIDISSSLDRSMFSVIGRDDGTEQLTVNGMPLYWYTPDQSPGDTMGQGFNDVWFVVDPTGVMLESAAAGTGDTVIDYDY